MAWLLTPERSLPFDEVLSKWGNAPAEVAVGHDNNIIRDLLAVNALAEKLRAQLEVCLPIKWAGGHSLVRVCVHSM